MFLLFQKLLFGVIHEPPDAWSNATLPSLFSV